LGKVKKARKVYTPGSRPKDSGISPGRGRPKKKEMRKPGWSRKGNYRTKYSPEALLKAIKAVQEKRMSAREAAKLYQVPKTTILDRISGRSSPAVGHPTELSQEEESVIVERLVLMGRWGFPLSRHDLSHLIKAYLDAEGRTSRFVDNLPGPDFMKCFMKRHPQLTVRTANMIKRARAALSHKDVNDFFARFEKVMADVEPHNVWNYDETCHQDNPGALKAFFEKGIKYAEQVRDHTKSSISVMYCGSASGVLLPPYIVYKAANIYESWCEGGPKGALYNCSANGWFDTFLFGEWFHKLFLPAVRRQPGKKVLIGDNLSSHLSIDVINTCRDEGIEFVCLPPNSTDKMQPLDVGFFGPLKSAWRKQLKACLGLY
jgi:hypothetical protein